VHQEGLARLSEESGWGNAGVLEELALRRFLMCKKHVGEVNIKVFIICYRRCATILFRWL